jgi:hypothetical protein
MLETSLFQALREVGGDRDLGHLSKMVREPRSVKPPCAYVSGTADASAEAKSAVGQTRKIRACPLHVRFTPLSGPVLKLVSVSAMGQSATSRGIRLALRSLCPNFWCLLQAQYAKRYCALRTVFPSVISGLRKPIAIQAAISLNMNLPEWPL